MTLWYSPRRTSVGSCFVFSSFNYGYFFIIINDFEYCWRALHESVIKRCAIAVQQFLRTSQTQYFCALVNECLSSSLICVTYSSCSLHIQLQQSNVGGQRLGKNRSGDIQGWVTIPVIMDVQSYCNVLIFLFTCSVRWIPLRRGRPPKDQSDLFHQKPVTVIAKAITTTMKAATKAKKRSH